jgi:hypothetical protein
MPQRALIPYRAIFTEAHSNELLYLGGPKKRKLHLEFGSPNLRGERGGVLRGGAPRVPVLNTNTGILYNKVFK